MEEEDQLKQRSFPKMARIADLDMAYHQCKDDVLQWKMFYFEGEDLACLLKSMQSQIESKGALNAALPDKFWLKQRFSIGVNEVTRVLERMPSNLGTESRSSHHLLKSSKCDGRKAPSVQLQAILLASDCTPRSLTKCLPALAASRKVPLIVIKDNKEGSLRLGELVKLKRAISIGIKARGNDINQLVNEILQRQDGMGA